MINNILNYFKNLFGLTPAKKDIIDTVVSEPVKAAEPPVEVVQPSKAKKAKKPRAKKSKI
jgi:hypothetical protein